ncbi:MAG TPA: hypothetical protein VJQ43_01500, partial [Thermoplasmata archaeon]|nr:hypothetical protein [Thermoplasmata archaeon]
PLLHRRTIGCRPNFPRTWNSATLEGVRMGPGRLSLTYRPGAVQARWDGPWAVTLSGERSSVRLEPSVPGILALAGAAPT